MMMMKIYNAHIVKH